MSKIHDVKEGDIIKHMFICQACGNCHFFIEPLWGWNQDREKPTVTGSILIHAHPGTPGVFKDTPRCHSLIKDGQIQYLSDCSHDMANKTIEIPDFDEWFMLKNEE
jgi:hypothetical protein